MVAVSHTVHLSSALVLVAVSNPFLFSCAVKSSIVAVSNTLSWTGKLPIGAVTSAKLSNNFSKSFTPHFVSSCSSHNPTFTFDVYSRHPTFIFDLYSGRRDFTGTDTVIGNCYFTVNGYLIIRGYYNTD